MAEETVRQSPRGPGLMLAAAALGCLIAGSVAAQRAGEPPVASFTWDPFGAPYYTEVTFDASESTDPDGEIISYSWDFGDGVTAEGKVVRHVYGQNGNFRIRLTVVDDTGLSGTKSVDVPFTDTYRY